MDPCYGVVGPAITCFLAMLLRSLLRNLNPPAVGRSLCLSLRASSLLTQTTAFTHLHAGLYLGLRPSIILRSWNAHPLQSMASLGARIPAPLVSTISMTDAWKDILAPTHKNGLVPPSKKFPTKIPHIGK